MLLGHTPERIAEEGRTIDVVKIINVIVEQSKDLEFIPSFNFKKHLLPVYIKKKLNRKENLAGNQSGLEKPCQIKPIAVMQKLSKNIDMNSADVTFSLLEKQELKK